MFTIKPQLKVSVSNHRTMMVLLLFRKICQKCILFGQYFPATKFHWFVFNKVRNMRKGEQKVDTCTAQKMTFSIKDLFGKCDQIQETPFFVQC